MKRSKSILCKEGLRRFPDVKITLTFLYCLALRFFSEKLIFYDHQINMPVYILCFICFVTSIPVASGGFSFASYYEDHMVLQQAPAQANIWGYANILDVGKSVQIAVFNNTAVMSTYSVKVFRGTGQLHDTGLWRVMLKPLPVGGPYRLKFTLGTTNIFLNDVLSGDVFICSGQSNMEFTLSMSYLGKEEIALASNYKNIRVFAASKRTSSLPLADLLEVGLNWSLPTPKTIGGGKFAYFSAVCWLYGRMLYDQLKIPIGLVESCWGGTSILVWSSPDALKQCPSYDQSNDLVFMEDRPDWMKEMIHLPPSVLWNAMIHPFLNMTLKGSIWYQGEANALSNIYDCMFKAMIEDWRSKFWQGSSGQTSITFPFGFVQLADNSKEQYASAFPNLRWQQTHNVGFVPNKYLPNVFMAVALDLPDFLSPAGAIHPRDKTTVGKRLVSSALNVIYGQKIKFQGPFPTSISLNRSHSSLEFVYDKRMTNIAIRSSEGFEVCCKTNATVACKQSQMTDWISVPISNYSDTSVTVSYKSCGSKQVLGVRYIWRTIPCRYKACPVYAIENELPAPPFFFNLNFADQAGVYYPNEF